MAGGRCLRGWWEPAVRHRVPGCVPGISVAARPRAEAGAGAGAGAPLPGQALRPALRPPASGLAPNDEVNTCCCRQSGTEKHKEGSIPETTRVNINVYFLFNL